jgi:hypothetical protein
MLKKTDFFNNHLVDYQNMGVKNAFRLLRNVEQKEFLAGHDKSNDKAAVLIGDQRNGSLSANLNWHPDRDLELWLVGLNNFSNHKAVSVALANLSANNTDD